MAATEGKALAPLKVRQLFDRESCTYTYIVHDEETRDAVLLLQRFPSLGKRASVVYADDE